MPTVYYWGPVDGASTYNVEVDCFGCGEYPSDWYSPSGTPWHVKRGLGMRPLGSPIYSSDVREITALARPAVDSDGREGKKSDSFLFP